MTARPCTATARHRGRTWHGVGLVAAVLAGAGVVGAVAATAGTADPPVPGIAPVASVVAFGLPVLRALSGVAAMITVGLSLLPVLARTFDGTTVPEGAAIVRRTRTGALVAAVAWSVSALATTGLQAAELDPTAPLTAGVVADLVQRSGTGQGLLVTAGAALGCAVLAAYGLRRGRALPPEPQLGLALVGLLPGPAFGHASSTASSRAHAVMLLAAEIHVLAATAWVGGLAALVAFAVRQHRLLVVALPRFSRLAGLCLAGVAVSGVVAGAMELGTASPSALLTSSYGGLILSKIGVTAAVAAIGAHMRRRLVRRALEGRPDRFATWATAELALMGVAFGIAVVLGHSGG